MEVIIVVGLVISILCVIYNIIRWCIESDKEEKEG